MQYVERHWVALAGGVLAADSPKMFFEMVDSLEQAGVRDVVEGYLGERAAISAQKCTLRKAEPDVKGGWHQDGKFLGEVRALNVWLSLSRCGDVAPSMDIVPVRLDDFVAAGVNEGDLHYQVTDETAADAAGETGVVRPIFNPGDVLLFDEMFLPPDRIGPVDAQPPLRDRELVLRSLGLPRRVRTDRFLIGSG